MPEPGDAITWREAGAILGVGLRRVAQLIANGQLTRGPRWQHRQLSSSEVEALALRRWNPRSAAPDSYWLGTKEARSSLGSTGPECASSSPPASCRPRRHRTGTPFAASSY
jgi:hypothetical protein